MYLFKIKALLFLFLTTINAYNFKLCCPFAHQYNILNETCFSRQEPQNLKIYNLSEEVNEISGKFLNVINYAWCRNEDGLREVEEIGHPYYLQENGELYVSVQEEYFKPNRFCWSIKDSSDENIPIVCKFEVNEPDTTTVENIISSSTSTSRSTSTSTSTSTTVSIDTTLPDKDCDCMNKPPRIPEIFCESLFNGTFEYCAKCTIENTCSKDECSTTNISLIEFVDELKETRNKLVLVVQVNKKECPYWQYTYSLNKNNTVHLSILKQTCDESKITSTKASFNAGILLYVGIAFLIIILLVLIGIIIYFIKQKRINAAQYAALVRDIKPQETELNPIFRPHTEIYRVPENSSFK